MPIHVYTNQMDCVLFYVNIYRIPLLFYYMFIFVYPNCEDILFFSSVLFNNVNSYGLMLLYFESSFWRSLVENLIQPLKVNLF